MLEKLTTKTNRMKPIFQSNKTRRQWRIESAVGKIKISALLNQEDEEMILWCAVEAWYYEKLT